MLLMGAVMVVDGGYSQSKRAADRTTGPWRPCAAWILLLSLVLCAGAVRADEASCGAVTNAFGPFDYRTATKETLARVEVFHFTPNVERLTRGETTAYVGGDIDYTLRAFPNHYRALMSMSKLSLQQNRPTPVGSKYSIECWFDRAFRFQPDDAMPRMVAGLHFTKLGRREEALENLALAAQLSDGNSNLHYNLGLAYLDLKLLDDALLHAKKAYAAGFPLPGLRNRLREAGAWRE
jgi:tetratricopeptide (TPR) repeat protein